MIQRRFPKLLGLALAATLATTTAAAWADAPQTGTPTSPPGHHRFQERLGLTDQQVAAIKEVNARHNGEASSSGNPSARPATSSSWRPSMAATSRARLRWSRAWSAR